MEGYVLHAGREELEANQSSLNLPQGHSDSRFVKNQYLTCFLKQIMSSLH